MLKTHNGDLASSHRQLMGNKHYTQGKVYKDG